MGELKKGQILYSTSIVLILIGFSVFGIFLLSHYSISGNVISDIHLTTSCSDSEIQSVWDSIFTGSSSGATIIKNSSVFAGKCSSYFMYKFGTDKNISYVLQGYTAVESGKNATHIIAEVIDSFQYRSLLLNITSIENFSLIPVRDNSLIINYVDSRGETVTSSNADEVFNKSFKESYAETWSADTSFGLSSFTFLDDVSNNNRDAIAKGMIMKDYGYSSLIYTFNPVYVECSEDIVCGSWSNCLNGSQNKTCANYTCGLNESYIMVQSCNESCIPNWYIGNWSSCVDGLQTRSVFDLNGCVNNTENPITNRICSNETECVPDWQCDVWAPVTCPSTGFQKRNCTDVNNCGESFKIETQSCGVTTTTKPTSTSVLSNTGISLLFIFITIIVIIIIIGLIVWLVFLMKKKSESANGEKTSSGSPPINPFSPSRFSGINNFSAPVKRIIPKNFPRPFQRPVFSEKSFAKSTLPNNKPVIQEKSKLTLTPAKKPEIDISKSPVKNNSSKSIWSSLNDISKNSSDKK